MSSVADAYNATGAAWQAGPGVVYDRLAEVAVGYCRVSLDGARVLDLGAGTGAVSRAALAKNASVIALDAAWGMLATDASRRPPAVVGDALLLPFASASFDAVIAGFSLNHVTDPVAALRECRRMVGEAGCIVATAYAEDDTHPVKEAVESAAKAQGWQPEDWYQRLRAEAVPLLATVERAERVAREAGENARVSKVQVAFPDLTPEQLVAWRMGMAQLAPFLAGAPAATRATIASEALASLGDNPPAMVRSVIVLVS